MLVNLNACSWRYSWSSFTSSWLVSLNIHTCTAHSPKSEHFSMIGEGVKKTNKKSTATTVTSYLPVISVKPSLMFLCCGMVNSILFVLNTNPFPSVPFTWSISWSAVVYDVLNNNIPSPPPTSESANYWLNKWAVIAVHRNKGWCAGVTWYRSSWYWDCLIAAISQLISALHPGGRLISQTLHIK